MWCLAYLRLVAVRGDELREREGVDERDTARLPELERAEERDGCDARDAGLAELRPEATERARVPLSPRRMAVRPRVPVSVAITPRGVKR